MRRAWVRVCWNWVRKVVGEKGVGVGVRVEGGGGGWVWWCECVVTVVRG